jgi:hypothetical protein
MEANQWPLNLGSERNWGFSGSQNSHLNVMCMSIPFAAKANRTQHAGRPSTTAYSIQRAILKGKLAS